MQDYFFRRALGASADRRRERTSFVVVVGVGEKAVYLHALHAVIFWKLGSEGAHVFLISDVGSGTGEAGAGSKGPAEKADDKEEYPSRHRHVQGNEHYMAFKSCFRTYDDVMTSDTTNVENGAHPPALLFEYVAFDLVIISCAR